MKLNFFPFFLSILFFLIFLTFVSNIKIDQLTLISKSKYIINERDDAGNIEYNISKIINQKNEKKKIFFIGGSGLREALKPVWLLENIIKEKNQNVFSIYNLSSSNQNLFDSYNIINTLVDHSKIIKDDVLIININHKRLNLDNQQIKDSINDSKFIFLEQNNNMFDEYRNKDLLYLISLKLKQWILSRKNFSVNKLYFQYAYPSNSMSEEKKQIIYNTIKSSRISNFKPNLKNAEKILFEIALLQERVKFKLIFLDLPRDPLSYEAYSSIENDYRKFINKFSTEKKYDYIDLRTLDYTSEDFFDLDHIISKKRNELTEIIIKKINILIN